MELLAAIKPRSHRRVRRREPDELTFRPSSGTSLGVKMELQILDRTTGDLAPGATRIVRAYEDAGVPGVSVGLTQSMIAIKTGACNNVADVRDQLVPQLRRVRDTARSIGYELAMAGTHPFHRTNASVALPDEQCQRNLDRLAWMIHQRVVFGLHVHVGMPSGDTAIGVINMLVQYIPHLVALSANSPFWQGVDTGMASCRTALYRAVPHAGVPRYFPNWKGFRTFCRVMRDCRAIASPKDLHWDIRPRPELGTIEFRVCDQPPTLAITFSIVALIRCLVLNAVRLLDELPLLRRGDTRRHWIAVENKWLAARYGLGAMSIHTPGGKRRPLDHDLRELIHRLLPIARVSGDERFLAAIHPVEQLESGADRQRRLYRDSGNWKSLIDDMTQHLSDELEAFTRDEVESPEVI